MRLNLDDYRDKVMGCWLGKNVGGTFGAPFEWKRQINDVDFYVQDDLSGEPWPNDDLDIQLLWLIAMEEMGIDIDTQRLAEYWCTYVTPHWAEYGTAKINMRQGLMPPLSGSTNNAFKHSCGAFIRSEIWACIAPGLPALAASYAAKDAALDHGDGEGSFAEIFMAAMESAAFVVQDLRSLINIGLSYIPPDCGVAGAIRTTLDCVDEGRDWKETRNEILRKHRGATHMGNPSNTSEEDRARGFDEGQIGYDVPSNIALTLLALLDGGADFGRVQQTAVNCGEDTDCTAATSGSVWGIIHGANDIPERWIEPIGHGIKTVVLNKGELGFFGNQIPQTVDELTERTERIARQILMQHRATQMISERPTDLADLSAEQLESEDQGAAIRAELAGPRFEFDLFTIDVNYGDGGPFISPGIPKDLTVTIHNTYKTQANLSLHWFLPDGWTVQPSADGYALSFPQHMAEPVEKTYRFRAPEISRATNRAAFQITCEGRPTVMLVPIVLLAGERDLDADIPDA